MPLPTAPKVLGDIVDKSEYGSRKKAGAKSKKAPAPIQEKPKQKKAGKVALKAPTQSAGTESKRQAAAQQKPSSPKAGSQKGAGKRAEKSRETKKQDAKAVSFPQSLAKEKAPAGKPENTGAARLRSARGLTAMDKPRLFVLDTNVLLHDPTSIFRFEEHDVFLPMTTLEELDNHKTGLSDIARNARQVSRWIDQLIESGTESITKGVALNGLGHTLARGKLFFETSAKRAALPEGLPQGKADNMILATVKALAQENPGKNVVLVSKDINMRIKATALGLMTEDYFNDKTIDDKDLLYTGTLALPADFWEQTADTLQSWQADGRTWYKFTAPFVTGLFVNEFVFLPDGSFVGEVKAIEGNSATVATVRDYLQPKNSVWGIHARNLEQSLALNLLMDPDIDFVTLLGQAGTGKTLMTLAAALTQTLDQRKFSEIIFTRATVSVGEEIGFLPGTEEEKMAPWMGALEDNLEVLNKSDRNGAGDWGRSAAADLIRSRIRIKSMSFMRGRTFLNKFVIIDEAQNLSPKQMKTLITRAGPGTKIVCLGNIAQIDTPYLTEGSSGLTYVVDRFKGWEHAGHITLQRGERSRLADRASDVL